MFEGSNDWTAEYDYDVFDRQIASYYNPVDGHGAPVQYYGVVLTMPEWQKLADRLRAHDVQFIIEPHVRFKDQVGEQATVFLFDPTGNALEFKAIQNIEGQLFAR